MNPFLDDHQLITAELDERDHVAAADLETPINTSTVKHRSPFRYPGGKTWLVPQVRKWLSSLQPPVERFVEPFAGGAIVGLTALIDRYAERLTLIERDLDVAAVWEIIANGDAGELADRIMSFEVTPETVDELFRVTLHPADIIGRAFVTIVRNRVQRGGIIAPGASVMRNGENGRGIRSRWYPETLKNRLLDLHRVHDRIDFVAGDGIDFLKKNADEKNFVWFIDPPYTVAGRRLYLHSQIDHAELFRVAKTLAGDFLMTYDNAPEVRELAHTYGFVVKEIAMKNSHHAVMSELLISNDLGWL